MRTLQFVCDGSPGGGTNHVIQVLKGMPDAHQCALLTQADSYLQQEAEKLGVDVYTGDFFRGRTDRQAIARVSEVILSVQPDLVHCHGGRAAFFRSWSTLKTSTVYTVHGFHFATKSLVPKSAGWLGEMRSIRASDHVIFVSQHDANLASQYRLLPKNKPHQVIHNGIQPPTPRRAKPGLGVGFVGRFVPQKNPELFVEMFQHLPAKTKGVMVGGGELESQVKEAIASKGLTNRIQLLGELGHEAALDTIAKLDVLVMTPRWEGLPLLPLEAMHLGVPVVSTAVGGIPEVINHAEHGFLAHNRSAQSLADFTSYLLEDKRIYREITDNARKRVVDGFGEAQMTTKLKQVYQSLINKQIKTQAKVFDGFSQDIPDAPQSESQTTN